MMKAVTRGAGHHGPATRAMASSLLLMLAALCSVLAGALPVHAQTKNTGRPGHDNEAIEEIVVSQSREEKSRFRPSVMDFTVIGQTRQRATFIENLGFGEERTNGDWFYTHRYMLGVEAKGEHVRGLAEISAAFDHGSEDPNSPVEENQVAIQRLWGEFDLLDDGSTTLAVRVGRDEWRLGSQRLVGWRDGTNVRRRFDGARVFIHSGAWDAQVLFGGEVENDPGVFDDELFTNRLLWGVYATRALPFDLPGKVDIYYLGFDDERGRTLSLTGQETRHSVGTRLFGKENGWDWNWEFVYQFGRFAAPDGTRNISAWTAASITGYRFEDLPLSPRLALSANIASGDGDPSDNTVASFNALFPRGSYFSELAQLGPRNFYNLNPYLSLQLSDRLTLITDINFFWRYSTNDGVYGPPGNLLRGPNGSNERFVNTAVSVNFEWEVTDKLFLGSIYTHSMPEDFILSADPEATAVDFIELTLRLDL